MSHMIDYIDATGRLWGAARRRLDSKLERWPCSIAGRIADALPSYREQRYPEVFVGEVLKFNMAVHRLSEAAQRIIYTHYVIALPARKKAKLLHVSHTTYYADLTSARRHIANYLDYFA